MRVEAGDRDLASLLSAPRPPRCAGASLALAAVLLVGLGAPSPARALDPSRRIDQFLTKRWTPADGLPHRTVYDLVQSRDGYLWIATQNGLARFDGFRFALFNRTNEPGLGSGHVKALLEGEDGTLWAAVYGGGVARYRDGHFTLLGAEIGLPSLLVRSLALAPGGGLWIGTEDQGAVRFDGVRVVERIGPADGLPSPFVRKLLVDRSGALWIGTDTGGLTRRADGRLTTWTAKSGLSGVSVIDLLETADGAIWAATSGGLDRFAAGNIRRYGLADGLPNDYVFSLGADRDGNLWVGTGGGGLARFRDGRFASFGVAQGLPDPYVWAITEDREGNLWVGTEGGLLRLRTGAFVGWGELQGVAGLPVRGLCEASDGSMLFATSHGLARLQGDEVAMLAGQGGFASDPLWSLLETRTGELWLGSDDAGTLRWRSGKLDRYRAADGVGSDTVWSLAEGGDGAIWAGTNRGGLARFAAGRWTRLRQADGLGGETVRTLLVDHAGDLWAGTIGGGLSRVRAGRIDRFTTEQGLGSNSVLALHEDGEGRLWVGLLSGGLAVRDGERFLAIPRAALPLDTVAGVVEDDLGHLWLTADGGIRRVARTDLLAAARGERTSVPIDVFGAGAGFLGDAGAGYTPVSWRGRDGRLWFATSLGAFVLDPHHLPPRPAPPTPLVEGLVANAREVPRGTELQLPAETFSLELHYTAPALSTPEAVRFRYRLAGFDRDWVEAGERRVAYYTNLPPRELRFEVAARVGDGDWTAVPTRLALRRLPLFRETWLFRALVAAAMLGLLALLYRLRTAQLAARAAVAEERNRLAREIHDTIAQDLASIVVQARVARKQAAVASPEASGRLEQIVRIAEGSLAEARQSLQALRPPALEGRDLATALREAAAASAGEGGVTVDVVSTLAGALPAAVESELLRIAKEAIGNALRHGGAGRVGVELRREGSEVVLVVADDGRGFDPAAVASDRFGLVGMRERAQTLGGTLRLESAAGRGTRVEARVPVGGRPG